MPLVRTDYSVDYGEAAKIQDTKLWQQIEVMLPSSVGSMNKSRIREVTQTLENEAGNECRCFEVW